MMTPSGFIKPKLGFSIESLVGGRATPPLSEDEEETDSLNNGFVRSHSPAPLGPFFSRALLNNHEEKSPVIQRPQPINGAARRTSTDLESHLPAALQSSKGFGAIPNLLIPPPVGMPSFPHLQGVSLPSHLNPFMMGPAGIPGFGATIPREYPLYPWLLSRHGRVFSQGFPSPEQLAYLLQPFRKPKRVRTAFSPSQLLKLEQAFEKNQYVVGVERKQLAQNLNLSETQVKVWFQNRRTKEKRTQPDEEGDMEDGMKKLNDNEDDEDDDFEESLKKQRKNGENKKADLSDDDDEVAKRRKIFEENGSDPKLVLPPPAPPSSSSSSSAFMSAASSFSSASRNLATLSMDGGELISDSIIGQNPFAGISPNESLRAKKIAT